MSDDTEPTPGNSKGLLQLPIELFSILAEELKAPSEPKDQRRDFAALSRVCGSFHELFTRHLYSDPDACSDAIKWGIEHKMIHLIKKALSMTQGRLDPQLIQRAMKANFTEAVRLFLEADFAFARLDECGRSVYHFAAQENWVPVMEVLRSRQIDGADAGDNFGFTPLHLAAEQGNFDAAEWLIDHGDINQRDHYNTTALHRCFERTLFTRRNSDDVISGKEAITRLLLSKEDIDPDVVVYGETAVTTGLDLGNLDIVKWVLKHREPNLRYRHGNTILLNAVDRKQMDVVKLLFDEPTIDFDATNGEQQTALHIAARAGNLKMVELLLPRCNPNPGDSDGRSPLLAALFGERRDEHGRIFTLLTENSDVDVNGVDSSGKSAAHILACSKSTWSTTLMKTLTEHARFNPNLQNERGNTPLHNAGYTCNTHIFGLLCNMKNTNVNLPNQKGDTVLHVCAEKGFAKGIELLLKRRDLDGRLLNKDSSTAAHSLALGSKYCANIEKSDYGKALQLLLPRLSLMKLDSQKRAVIHYATISKWTYGVQTLLKLSNINVNKVDKYGESPIFYAVYQRCYPILQLFLERDDVNVNRFNKRRQTPLLVAAGMGWHEGVSLIVKCPRVNLMAKDANGNTALHYITKQTHFSRTIIPAHADAVHCSMEYPPKNDGLRALLGQLPEYTIGLKNTIDLTNKNAESALHLAVRYSFPAAVRLLLVAKIDINLVDKNRRTALHYSCEAQDHESTKRLLDHRTIDITIRDNLGKTAEDVATEKRYKQGIQLFRDYAKRTKKKIQP